MKALKTIGIKKACRFIFFQIYGVLLSCVLIPQIRVFFMRLMGASIGSGTIIHNAKFSNLYHYGFLRLFIGNNCYIGDDVLLDCRGKIIMEDHVTISERSNIVTHINVGYPDHPLQKKYPTKEGSVKIYRGAYIGIASTILPGVTIGKESIVAAGAVVVKDVPAYSVVAGVPARMVKKIR